MVKAKKGQILILVLLVVVVSLAIGLSVASRNLTNLRTSTQAEQSQRAFTTAEGGVENTLSNLNKVAQALKDGNDTAANSGCSISSGVATCSLNSAATDITGDVKVAAKKAYERLVEPGDVAQINLSGMSGTFDVFWSKKVTAEQSPNKATLEFTFICQSPSPCMGDAFAGAYGQHREAFSIDSIGSQGSGIILCGNPFGTTTTSTTDPNYNCKATFTIPAAANVRMVRIKPFWNRATVSVSSAAGSFPVQTYEITSTAKTDSGLSRKVEVKRDAIPQLPAVFDYALYSGKDIIK